jgi:hypothetical protein
MRTGSLLRSMLAANDTDGMEQPVPCDECGSWVELNDCAPCRDCRRLVCRRCIDVSRVCYDCQTAEASALR